MKQSLKMKTHNHKSSKPTLPPDATKTQTRKKLNSRNPFQDLSNGCIGSTSTTSSTGSVDGISNSSSMSSTEAPKGCLRLLLSHSSSSTKAPSNFSKNNRLATDKTFPLKTPKSAPNLRPTTEKSSKGSLLQRPISHKWEKGSRNRRPCLYQWHSGKKPSYGNTRGCKVSSFLDSGRRGMKSVSGELRQLVVDGVRDSDAANFTPLSKMATVSGLNIAVDGKGATGDGEGSNNSTSTKSASSNSKTPPIQASVSPEIHCGSLMVSTTTQTGTSACYAAGHVLSGVSDKRKCRPRGMLTVGEAKAIGSFESDEDNDKEIAAEFDDEGGLSMLPTPAEASMHWLLSPCKEEGENQKENLSNRLCQFHRLKEYATQKSPASSSSGKEGLPSDESTRTRNASPVCPGDMPEFRGFPRSSSHDIVALSPFQEDRKTHYDLDWDNSPFSMYTLDSGNVIQTPQSNSSSDERVDLALLNADTCNFDSQFNSVAEGLQMASLSPKSHASIWDPSSSFQLDCLSTSSTSVDLLQFQKILDDRASWFSNSTVGNVSQSQMRISWRDGLISRIFEMDDIDCCRSLSDEDDDGACCNNDYLNSRTGPEPNVDMEKGEISVAGFGSTELVEREHESDKKVRGECPPSVSCSCAESISTDGGGLVRSEDSDWTLCYRNQLFHI
ncbi:hypothetical protein K2173_018948 [Erythroxylum novogranatense]|uniref:Uncharacterized protein n=1 Tax=Erythroxylum novogranatense TaxID=1862640 RepID=A0AAV8SSX6_9ROSI|nr:hypothetical protein K2173_018948 [Erythroxylum novogranatense]